MLYFIYHSEIQVRFETLSASSPGLLTRIIKYITGIRSREEREAVAYAIKISENCYALAGDVQIAALRSEEAIKSAESWLLTFRKGTKRHRELSVRRLEALVHIKST